MHMYVYVKREVSFFLEGMFLLYWCNLALGVSLILILNSVIRIYRPIPHILLTDLQTLRSVMKQFS